MSKIICECGYVIPDTTDYIWYKARVIADQDFDDFFDEIESECPHKAPSKARGYFNDMFQCPECGTLIIDDTDGERYDFPPLNKEKWGKVTLSCKGEKWKGHLYGNYYGANDIIEYRRNKGRLYWMTNKESGYIEDMTLEELRDKYYKKFEELNSLGILRSSYLNIDGNGEHNWPDK